MKTAYLIGGYRTAVGKSGRGALRFTRPDDMAAQVIRGLMKDFPEIDKEEIDDVIVGNAMPEAEQGLNVGRLISLLGLDTDKVPGMTVNRYCSSGLETIALAVAKIERGMGDCIIAGGVESMSYIPMGGWKPLGEPFLENNQMEPDIEVRNDPGVMALGIDQQLDAAVRELLKE